MPRKKCSFLKFIIVQSLIINAKACFWRSNLSKDDCEDFEKLGGKCENIYKGRLQATEMTADLYKVNITIRNTIQRPMSFNIHAARWRCVEIFTASIKKLSLQNFRLE